MFKEWSPGVPVKHSCNLSYLQVVRDQYLKRAGFCDRSNASQHNSCLTSFALTVDIATTNAAATLKLL